MHGNRSQSALQRSATPDNIRNQSMVGANSEAFGQDYAYAQYEKSPYQSTPKQKRSSSYGEPQNMYSAASNMKPLLSKSASSGVAKYSANQTNTSFINGRSPSPSKTQFGSLSPTKISDMETSMVQRQRRELQLLMNELKDRDRELNEMVDSHQKQLIAWETDRKRVLVVENQLTKYKADLKKKHEQAKAFKDRLKMTEQSELSKAKELQTTQLHLQQALEDRKISAQQLEELKESNEDMACSIQELSTSLGKLQAKEQELITSLKLKESDFSKANSRLNDLAKKARNVQTSLQESRKSEAQLKAEKEQWKEQYLVSKHEVEKLRSDINRQFNNADEHQAELSQIKQELLSTQKELFLAGEREKRKDQLLELSKSKQERTETELFHLRQLYERQQRDYTFLQQQVQGSEVDITDRISDMNTEDGLSEISTIGKRTMDDPVLNLDNFDIQDVNPNMDSGLNLDFLSNFYDKAMPTTKPHFVSRSATLNHNQEQDNEPNITNGNILETVNVDTSLSPKDRVNMLLAESRQMVENLESHSPLSSVNTSPDVARDIRNRSTEESFQSATLVNRLPPIKIQSFEEEQE
eukprot:gene14198-15679_t